MRNCGFRLHFCRGCPLFVLYLSAVLLRYDGDGTGPPRPVGTRAGPGHGLWVMACWWIPAGGKVRLCSHFRFLSRFWLLRFVPSGLEWERFVLVYTFTGPTGRRQSVLRTKRSPSVSTSFISCRSGCAERVKLLFAFQGGPFDARGATHRDVSGFCSRCFLFLFAFPLGSRAVVFSFDVLSLEKSPKESHGFWLVGAFAS